MVMKIHALVTELSRWVKHVYKLYESILIYAHITYIIIPETIYWEMLLIDHHY